MKILKKKNEETIRFGNIITGEPFYIDGVLYMKITPDAWHEQNINAVRLEDGGRVEIDEDLSVIQAHVHIEED